MRAIKKGVKARESQTGVGGRSEMMGESVASNNAWLLYEGLLLREEVTAWDCSALPGAG